jgi:hypothetical protein
MVYLEAQVEEPLNMLMQELQDQEHLVKVMLGHQTPEQTKEGVEVAVRVQLACKMELI